ncbi:MAG: glycoside hydrolase domain-containing protein [Victivallaceae bacterium]
MKKYVFVIMGVLFSLTLFGADTGKDNLVKNCSFEEKGKNSLPAFWSAKKWAKKLGVQVQTDETAVDGNFSLKIMMPENGKYRSGIFQKLSAMEAGKEYEISCWYKANCVSTIHIDIASGPGCRAPYVRYPFLAQADNKWHQVKTTLRTDPDQTRFFLEIACEGTYKQGDIVYFDKISIKEKTGLEITRFTAPPLINGVDDDDCWKAASLLNLSADDGGSLQNPTEVRIGYDENALYILYKCYESQMEKIKTAITAKDGRVWTDDSIELFLDTKNDFSYYHIIANSAGVIRDSYGYDPDWNGNYQLKTSKGKNYWMAEIAIPFSILNITPETGRYWKINFCRSRRIPPKAVHSAWSPTFGNFHSPEKFGTVYLKANFNRFYYSDLKHKLDKLSDDIQLNNSPPPVFKQNLETLKKLLLQYASRLESLKSESSANPEWASMADNIKILGKKIGALRTLCSLYGQNDSSGGKYITGVANNLQKIFKEVFLFEGAIDKDVRISAAKGEKEGFQIFLIPLFEDLKDVLIKVTDLSGADGTKINKEKIRIYKVDYVKNTVPPKFKVDIKSAEWPGPLCPLGKTLSVKEKEVQPFWFTITVPEATPAGKYEGTITIKPNTAHLTLEY